MDLKKLEKAQKIFIQVQALDKQILEIEKIAQIVVSGGKHEFTFHATPLTSEKKKNVLDSDGSLIVHDEAPKLSFGFRNIFEYGCPTVTVTETPKHKITEKADEQTALLLLGVLIENKNAERKALLAKLTKLGVQVA